MKLPLESYRLKNTKAILLEISESGIALIIGGDFNDLKKLKHRIKQRLLLRLKVIEVLRKNYILISLYKDISYVEERKGKC